MAVSLASHRFPTHLKLLKYEIELHARSYGLDFFDTIFEVLDYDEMNEVAAYGGFPSRFPHWRFGMAYEELSKGYSYGLQKIYEMVINNDPCYAYLLRSNNIVDQKIVMAHVYAHCDFFKNNVWFSRTNRKMVDEMANHGTRIQNHAARHGEDDVEAFLDTCLSIEDLIDPHAPFIQRRRPVERSPFQEAEETQTVQKMKSKDYMDGYINPRAFLEAEQKKIEAGQEQAKQFPETPERDVMLFMVENAPLENWQRDILSMVREEAYYFAPQGQTKILNEGWACVTGDALVLTDCGPVAMQHIVENQIPALVNDGEHFRHIYDWARFKNRETVKIRTKNGHGIEGSVTHQLMLPGGLWKKMDDLSVGDRVVTCKGESDWTGDEVVQMERRRADVYDVSVEKTHRYSAQGFINHNSYWHSKIMTEKMLDPSEVIDYADHHSGTLGVQPGRINPYKLGIELFRDIEDRWDRGKFGPEYEACDDMGVKRGWDRQLGLGRQKIFEVRSIYNDVGFIDTFLTEAFCREHRMFTYRYNEQGNRYEIEGREFEKVKQKLLFSLTNHGRPFIYVAEANHRNRGELYLLHRFEGVELRLDYARDTLAHLHRLWGRPVHIETVAKNRAVVLSFDGADHTQKERGGA